MINIKIAFRADNFQVFRSPDTDPAQIYDDIINNYNKINIMWSKST